MPPLQLNPPPQFRHDRFILKIIAIQATRRRQYFIFAP
jgi:hypothetical protein